MPTATADGTKSSTQTSGPVSNYIAYSDEELLFGLTALNGSSHPKLVALSAQHKMELDELTTPLLASLVAKDKQDADELELFQQRCADAQAGVHHQQRSPTGSGTDADLAGTFENLQAIEQDEVARLVELQSAHRVRRVYLVQRLLETVRLLKENELSEVRGVALAGMGLELRLRKAGDRARVEGLQDRGGGGQTQHTKMVHSQLRPIYTTQGKGKSKAVDVMPGSQQVSPLNSGTPSYAEVARFPGHSPAPPGGTA